MTMGTVTMAEEDDYSGRGLGRAIQEGELRLSPEGLQNMRFIAYYEQWRRDIERRKRDGIYYNDSKGMFEKRREQ